MKLRSKLFYLYTAFLLVYAGFVLLPAPPKVTLLRYHLTATRLRLIDLTIIIFFAGIWFLGFYAYNKLRVYAALIREEKDGRQILKISWGVLLLALWLPVSSTLSAILQFIADRHPGFLGASIIINHYVGLALPLAGFILVGMGARGLTDLIRQRSGHAAIQVLQLLLIYTGLVYVHFVATTHQRDAVYYMSIWFILLTLVAPYVYMWFVGLIASYEIYRYQRQVAGIVYKKSWNLLALGLGWLIVTSIVFQFLTTATVQLKGLALGWLLGVVYLLLILLAVGFALTALGARKLRRIEEV